MAFCKPTTEVAAKSLFNAFSYQVMDIDGGSFLLCENIFVSVKPSRDYLCGNGTFFGKKFISVVFAPVKISLDQPILERRCVFFVYLLRRRKVCDDERPDKS